jgi:hypothetical protein
MQEGVLLLEEKPLRRVKNPIRGVRLALPDRLDWLLLILGLEKSQNSNGYRPPI